MNTLIENVRQWGKDKGITGPAGRGTLHGQAKKNHEEGGEIVEAVAFHQAALAWNPDEIMDTNTNVMKEVGDNFVTLILLCEMLGTTPEECLALAYEKISKRTGTMKNGVFVKESPSIDDDLGELDPSAACKLGDESCESCQ